MQDGPFHDGELLMQSRTGESKMARRSGRFILGHLSPSGARFLGVARVVNLGISDAHGRLWSFVMAGSDAFVSAKSDSEIHIALDRVAVPDALHSMLRAGAHVGLVAMDLTSARRLRLNGMVSDADESGVNITINETCPNCPKYIQQRTPIAPDGYQTVEPRTGRDLPDDLKPMIETADTFFVASRHPDGGHDASHRGGQPGFVTVSGNHLTIPDYIGNSMFMTLGNFTRDAAAGLTFVDFDTGSQLNLTGQTEITLDNPAAHDGTAGRFWRFEISDWSLAPFRPEPAWKLAGYSRFNPTIQK